MFDDIVRSSRSLFWLCGCFFVIASFIGLALSGMVLVHEYESAGLLRPRLATTPETVSDWFYGLVSAMAQHLPDLSVWRAAVYAALLVLLYAVSIYVLWRRYHTRPETKSASTESVLQQGRVVVNSIYYLGFTLTLFALICGFLIVAIGPTPNALTLLSQNAIALSSTAVGLILRVLGNFFLTAGSLVEVEAKTQEIAEEYPASVKRETDDFFVSNRGDAVRANAALDDEQPSEAAANGQVDPQTFKRSDVNVLIVNPSPNANKSRLPVRRLPNGR